MKIRPYIEKLESAKEFTNFKSKYPDAFIMAGFFVLDYEQGQNMHQIDFYLPKEKKVAAFTIDKGVQFQILETPSKKTPEKLDIKTNIDLDALKGILEDEMKNRSISQEIKKMIAVLQCINGKKIWNVNCVLSGMEILKSHIEDESETVLKLEKISMMDIMKKIPTQELMQQKPSSKKDIQIELQKLDKIEEELEKEKSKLNKELLNKGEIKEGLEKEKTKFKKELSRKNKISIKK